MAPLMVVDAHNNHRARHITIRSTMRPSGVRELWNIGLEQRGIAIVAFTLSQ